MPFGLLIELEVVQFAQALPRAQRLRLLDHFRQIRDFPLQHSDYVEHDSAGRRVDVSVFEGMAIYYWTDHADRQVKILRLIAADTE